MTGALCGFCWGPLGWKPAPRAADPDDFAYAAKAGYLFDDAVTGHDELVSQIADLGRQVSLADACDAFLASLSARWLFLRPFLPSLIVARSMPRHSFEPAAGARAPGGRGLAAAVRSAASGATRRCGSAGTS